MASKGNTFIHERVGLQPFDAIQLNHYTRVQLFLKNGLDPDHRDLQRRTLLMSACCLQTEKSAGKYCKLLLKYKARIELSDGNGMNSMHYAVLNEQENIVSRFLEFAGNFDINMKDSFGNTALVLAVFTRNDRIVEKMVQSLRKYDLSVDICNADGITPLILATLLHEDAIAKCLIEVGKASTQIRDRHFRKTAKDWQHDTSKDRCILRGSSTYTAIRKQSITRNPSTFHDVLKDCTNLSITNPTLKRATQKDPSGSVSYPLYISSDRFPKLRPEKQPKSEERIYRYPDLIPVYKLYEQEIASSYRKSAPPRVKTPPEPSSDSSVEGTWRKTILAMKLRQRRHTIALSRSLPNNFSTKKLFGLSMSEPQSRSNSLATSEAIFDPTQWSEIQQNTRRNSLRLPYSSPAPATAPGELELGHRRSSISKEPKLQRRLSVSFVVPENEMSDNPPQSPRSQRSVLKYNKLENELPIVEEDTVRLNED